MLSNFVMCRKFAKVFMSYQINCMLKNALMTKICEDYEREYKKCRNVTFKWFKRHMPQPSKALLILHMCAMVKDTDKVQKILELNRQCIEIAQYIQYWFSFTYHEMHPKLIYLFLKYLVRTYNAKYRLSLVLPSLLYSLVIKNAPRHVFHTISIIISDFMGSNSIHVESTLDILLVIFSKLVTRQRLSTLDLLYIFGTKQYIPSYESTWLKSIVTVAAYIGNYHFISQLHYHVRHKWVPLHFRTTDPYITLHQFSWLMQCGVTMAYPTLFKLSTAARTIQQAWRKYVHRKASAKICILCKHLSLPPSIAYVIWKHSYPATVCGPL